MHTDPLEIDLRESRLKRMRRNILTSTRLLRDDPEPGFRNKWAMVTLTYRPGVEWDKRHVTGLVKNIREYLRRKGFRFRYVWVTELQQRGAVHYHLLIQLPKGITLPKPDRQGWWKHGSTRIEWARHPVGYMAKYATKGHGEQQLPKGCRISGAGGLSPDSKRQRRWWLAPSYVREAFGEASDPFRAKGGGWLDRETGELLASAWVLVAVGRRFLRLLPRASLGLGPPVLGG